MPCCLCIISGLVFLAFIWKTYAKLRIRQHGCYTCLVGKTAIVTGANAGIGYFTALDFAKRGARVILACRNEDRAEDAQRKIISATQNPNVVYRLVDFSSLDSVRAFAKEINESEERIDILVNNAGAIGVGDYFTKDGIQVVVQTNHISPFLLTHLLLDKIKKSAPSRIVNVSSSSAKSAELEIEAMNRYPTGFSKLRNHHQIYGNTKLYNILFTIILANKLRGTGVTANAVHPGPVKTDALRSLSGMLKVIVYAVISMYFRTAEEGARTSIYVATSEKLDGVTGKLFANCKEIDMYQKALDPVFAEEVWEKSDKLAKLSPNEKIK